MMGAPPARADLTTPAAVATPLERVALALSSSLEPKEVLRELATIALELTTAQRATLFLLEDDLLVPAVAVSNPPDAAAWTTFRSMPPVDITTIPGGWDALVAGRAVMVDDPATCDFVPTQWVFQFRAKALVLVPLPAEPRPSGLLVVDRPATGRFHEPELRTLEAVAGYAGVAVDNARLYATSRKRSRVQQQVAEAAAVLAEQPDPSEAATLLARVHAEITDADRCLIGLFDRGLSAIVTAAAWPARDDLPAPLPLSDVPERLVTALTAAWQEGGTPVQFDADPWLAELTGHGAPTHDHVIHPLGAAEAPLGVVVLAQRVDRRPGPEVAEAVTTLAAIASATLDRLALTEQLAASARRLEILHRLENTLEPTVDADGLVARLAELLASEGIEPVAVAFTDRRLRRRLGGGSVDAAERRARDAFEREDGSVSAPMRVAGRTVGWLRLRTEGRDQAALAFVSALADGVGEVAETSAMRRAMAEATQEQAVARERERIAADLHDAVGSSLVGLALLADSSARKVPHDPPSAKRFTRLAEIANGAKFEIDQAIRALTFVPAARRGLVTAMRDLASSVQDDSGITVRFECEGRWPRQPVPVERALYRVAHEALSNAWRHARCSTVRVSLSADRDELTLTITDDGTGLPDGPVGRLGVGIGSMRQAVSEMGGRTRVDNLQPHGLVVEATVPRHREVGS